MINTIGACIEVCRNSKRWTQERLASAINLTQGQLSDIENDKVSPRWETICLIAKALDVSVLQLLPEVDNNNNSLEQQLREALQKAQEEVVATKNKLIAVLEQK